MSGEGSTDYGYRIVWWPNTGEKRCNVLGDYSHTYATARDARAALEVMPTFKGDCRTYSIEEVEIRTREVRS